MDKSPSFLNTPVAILIGAVMISVAILVSGGIIKPKDTTNSTASANQSNEDKLVSLASSINLDKTKFKSCLDSQKYKAEFDHDNQDAETAGIQGTPGFIVGKTSSTGQITGIKIGGAFDYAVFQAVIDMLTANTPLDQIPKLVIDKVYSSATQSQKDDLTQSISANASAWVDDDPVLGNSNAPLTLIEFSDYECPFCKRHFDQTYPSLKKDYIETGKVKEVFRDFVAVPQHNPNATLEALATSCARDQGGDATYFKYHDLVYSKTKSNGDGVQ